MRKLRLGKTRSVCKLRDSRIQCDATNLGCLEMQFPNLHLTYEEAGYYRKSVRNIIGLLEDMPAFGSNIEFFDLRPRRSSSKALLDRPSSHAQCDIGVVLKHQANHYLSALKEVKFAIV